MMLPVDDMAIPSGVGQAFGKTAYSCGVRSELDRPSTYDGIMRLIPEAKNAAIKQRLEAADHAEPTRMVLVIICSAMLSKNRCHTLRGFPSISGDTCRV